MTVLPILIAPHPTLKAKAKPVKEVTDELRTLLDDMLETMYDAPGIGLAAPQIGVLKRVVVLDCAQRELTGVVESLGYRAVGDGTLTRSRSRRSGGRS